jgi:hypothetical protein
MTHLYDLCLYLCMGIGASYLIGSLIGLLICIPFLKRMFFDTDVKEKKPVVKPLEFKFRRNIW